MCFCGLKMVVLVMSLLYIRNGFSNSFFHPIQFLSIAHNKQAYSI